MKVILTKKKKKKKWKKEWNTDILRKKRKVKSPSAQIVPIMNLLHGATQVKHCYSSEFGWIQTHIENIISRPLKILFPHIPPTPHPWFKAPPVTKLNWELENRNQDLILVKDKNISVVILFFMKIFKMKLVTKSAV